MKSYRVAIVRSDFTGSPVGRCRSQASQCLRVFQGKNRLVRYKRERYEMSQKYSAEEVSRHNNADDLWIAIHGKVFDVTKFLKEHPGGEEVLLSLAGGDATKCFDDIGHSQEAIQLKDTFEIGTLQGELTSPVAAASTGPTVDDDDWVYEEPKKEANPYIPVFIGLAVVVYAVLFYYIF